jgi:predicted adenine nucleotide alpha hydrolase (AANH) superfamily ATPase
MGEAYDYAEKNGYDYFTTVMTISPAKRLADPQ